ncbi:MAG: hypothetical protein Q9168_007613 [Polycauliona sp. 1 TL-2023]
MFKPFSEFLTGPIVTVLVGPDRKAYKIHRDLLCDRSSHFRAAFLSQFQEAQTSVIELPEDDETAFKLFILWLYGSTEFGNPSTQYLKDYIQVLCFAQRILLPELHNDCIDVIRRYRYQEIKSTPSAKDRISRAIEAVTLVYDAIPKQKNLCLCFCLDMAMEFSRGSDDRAETWMDGDLSQLLQQGGDFASDFPKLLLISNRELNNCNEPAVTFHPDTNCMFHVDHSWNIQPRSADFLGTLTDGLDTAAEESNND